MHVMSMRRCMLLTYMLRIPAHWCFVMHVVKLFFSGMCCHGYLQTGVNQEVTLIAPVTDVSCKEEGQ